MGLFSSAPMKPSPSGSGAASFSGSRHISALELSQQVRRDLHDRLGRIQGESVYGMMASHLDRDIGAGSHGHNVSGSEIESTLKYLENNHRDNLSDEDVRHVRDILYKHYSD